MKSLFALLAIPALLAQVPLYVPGGLWMIIEDAQFAAAGSAKINFLVIVSVFFIEARLAEQSSRFHFPLPLWFLAIFNNLLAANRASIRRLFLFDHELFRFFEMAVAAK